MSLPTILSDQYLGFPISQDTTSYHDLQAPPPTSNFLIEGTLENPYPQEPVIELFDFLQKVDPENCQFIYGVLTYYSFTKKDVLMMKCCQLTALATPRDMVYFVRFWDKLTRYKNNSPPITEHTIEDVFDIKLVDILTWAVEKEIKGAITLKGLFGSKSSNGLSGTSQIDLTQIIISYLMEKRIKITDEILEELACQIKDNFKGESKDAYFKITKLNNRTVKTGKLQNKRYNIKREKTVTAIKPSKDDEIIDTIMSVFTSIESGKSIYI